MFSISLDNNGARIIYINKKKKKKNMQKQMDESYGRGNHLNSIFCIC